jgi:hypothetical protein
MTPDPAPSIFMTVVLPALIGAIAALVGAAVGGWCTLKAAREQKAADASSDAQRDKRLVQSFLQGILDELEVVWTRYYETTGRVLENSAADTPFMFYYPVFQEFFMIYTTMSGLVGRIEDADLRRSIVKTYTAARGLVDSFRFNNIIYEKFETNRAQHSISGQEQFGKLAAEYLDQMRRYGNVRRAGGLAALSVHDVSFHMEGRPPLSGRLFPPHNAYRAGMAYPARRGCRRSTRVALRCPKATD